MDVDLMIFIGLVVVYLIGVVVTGVALARRDDYPPDFMDLTGTAFAALMWPFILPFVAVYWLGKLFYKVGQR